MSRNTQFLDTNNRSGMSRNICSRGYENCPSDMSYSLIKRMQDAVLMGDLKEPFTTYDAEIWMTANNIRKEDGTKYKKGYVNSLLSNSLIKNKKTKNRNSKWLHRQPNEHGVYEYWFAE